MLSVEMKLRKCNVQRVMGMGQRKKNVIAHKKSQFNVFFLLFFVANSDLPDILSVVAFSRNCT